MNCDVYHTNRRRIVVLVPEGSDLDSLPAQVKDELDPLRKWKTISTGSKMIGVDHEKVEQDIERQGYSVSAWKMAVTEQPNR